MICELELLGPQDIVNGQMTLLIETVNQWVAELNGYIQRYREIEHISEKKELLIQIYRMYQRLYVDFSPLLIVEFVFYRETMLKKLFCEIQAELPLFGLSSLYDLEGSTRPLSRHAELVRLLEDMDPDEIKEFVTSFEDLNELIQSGRDAAMGMTILNQYTMSRIAKRNTIVLLMTRNSDQSTCVLKLAPCWFSQAPVNALRHVDALREVFAPSDFVRYVCNHQKMYKLETIPFYSHGSLDNYSAHCTDVTDKLLSALYFFSQMSSILLLMEANGYWHSDMKNANWLVDENDCLHLADTKMVLPIDDEGGFRFQRLSGTEVMNPPELLGYDASSCHPVSPVHAYILGKNLYHYLTCCSLRYLDRRHQGEEYDFSGGIFKTEIGGALKNLIICLIQSHAKQRMSLRAAAETLFGLHQAMLSTLINNQLERLIYYKMTTSDDVEMDIFITRKQQAFDEMDDIRALSALLKELKEVRYLVDNHPVPSSLPCLLKRNTTGLKCFVEAVQQRMLALPIAIRFSAAEQQAYQERMAKIERFVDELDEYFNVLTHISSFTLRGTAPDTCMMHFLQNKRDYIEALTPSQSIDLAGLKYYQMKLEAIDGELNQCMKFLSVVEKKYPQLVQEVSDLKTILYAIPIEERQVESQQIKMFTVSYRRFEHRVICLDLLKHLTCVPKEQKNQWMADATTQEQLAALQDHLTLRLMCLDRLKNIAQYQFGEGDYPMKLLISNTTEMICNLKSIAELTHLEASLNRTLSDLTDAMPLLKQIIDDFKQGSSFFSLRKIKKAESLELAITLIPVIYRNKVSLKTEPWCFQFRECLAARRRVNGLVVPRNPNNTLNLNRAAPSYSRFFGQGEVVPAVLDESNYSPHS